MSNKNEIYNFFKNEQKRKEYNDEIVNKTWQYQKKFGFKTSAQKDVTFFCLPSRAMSHIWRKSDNYKLPHPTLSYSKTL